MTRREKRRRLVGRVAAIFHTIMQSNEKWQNHCRARSGSSRPQNAGKYDDLNHERRTLLRNESRENKRTFTPSESVKAETPARYISRSTWPLPRHIFQNPLVPAFNSSFLSLYTPHCYTLLIGRTAEINKKVSQLLRTSNCGSISSHYRSSHYGSSDYLLEVKLRNRANISLNHRNAISLI